MTDRVVTALSDRPTVRLSVTFPGPGAAWPRPADTYVSARAARLLGWSDVPLLGAAEVAVPDGLPRCIRVLLHFYTTKPQRELKHMYLQDAAKLRPDREK